MDFEWKFDTHPPPCNTDNVVHGQQQCNDDVPVDVDEIVDYFADRCPRKVPLKSLFYEC